MKTHVVTISPDATLTQAIDLMDLYYVAGLPVVDAEERFCGLLFDSDVLQAVAERWHQMDSSMQDQSVSSSDIRTIANLRVGQVMRRRVVTLSDQEDVSTAIPIMMTGEVDRIPILDGADRVVGMLHRIDLLQALFEGVLA